MIKFKSVKNDVSGDESSKKGELSELKSTAKLINSNVDKAIKSLEAFKRKVKDGEASYKKAIEAWDESGIRAGRELYWTGARTTFDVMVAASKLK